MGAALLARQTTLAGNLSDGVEAVLHGIEHRWYEPSSDVAARYDEAYARYLELAAS